MPIDFNSIDSWRRIKHYPEKPPTNTDSSINKIKEEIEEGKGKKEMIDLSKENISETYVGSNLTRCYCRFRTIIFNGLASVALLDLWGHMLNHRII